MVQFIWPVFGFDNVDSANFDLKMFNKIWDKMLWTITNVKEFQNSLKFQLNQNTVDFELSIVDF